jgi:hypothetical protein
MDEVVRTPRALTFNGPLEAGVRAVAILVAAFPQSYDLQRMTAFDYLLVHTGQLGGPDDLHPSTPIDTPATEVRRKIVQDALHLMMTRDLITRHVDHRGILYRAGEAASMFLDSLRTPYLQKMKERALWLATHLSGYNDDAFDQLMRQFFNVWVMEFQNIERSVGAAT